MVTDKNKHRGILIGKGIKPTYQRMVILAAVAADNSHPTIRALHKRLVQTIPTLSKTTLYSTLELYAAKGLVTPLLIDPAEARFDGVLSPHHHFYCSACGRILDIELACPNSRRGAIHGHRIDEVHGYFKGVCADCLSAAPSPRPQQFIHKRRSSKNA
jgi:Fur family transcriptional regulator, peroxide stress response regulator